VAAALRQLRESFPDIFDARLWPNLAAHSDRCEGTELFQKISKPYTWPAA